MFHGIVTQVVGRNKKICISFAGCLLNLIQKLGPSCYQVEPMQVIGAMILPLAWKSIQSQGMVLPCMFAHDLRGLLVTPPPEYTGQGR